MRRHPALVPLSHDHHHTLAWASRLGRGETEGFGDYYARDLARHLRREEEAVFPLLAEVGCDPEELAQALLQHQQIRARAPRPDADLGELLREHIRLEERSLFETLQRVVPEERLASLLLAGPGGPEWGVATDELNATLVAWPPGEGAPAHVNAERDVLVVVLDGSAEIDVDGAVTQASPGQAVAIPKGTCRRIAAGPGGVRYLTVHRARSPLQIAAAPLPR